jgi:LysM repeat protein
MAAATRWFWADLLQFPLEIDSSPPLYYLPHQEDIMPTIELRRRRCDTVNRQRLRLRGWVGALAAFLLPYGIHADSVGTVAGLTLLEAPTARAAGLGEAFTAISNDAAGLSYNPASLGTLNQSQVSFLYHRGTIEDNYGQALLGLENGWAFGVGAYNGGDFEYKDGATQKTVNTQKDLLMNLGYGRAFGPVELGVAGKYFSSELVEEDKSTVFAMDLGGQYGVADNLRLGMSFQNLGSKLKYADKGSDVPRTVRAGASFEPKIKSHPVLLVFDVPYDMVEKKMRIGFGLEVPISLLSLRIGYASGRDLEHITLGAGFAMRGFTFDYAFGIVEDLDARQRVSVGYRFGGKSDTRLAAADPAATSKKVAVPSAPTKTAPAIPAPRTAKKGRIYEVKAGDTLSSIAQREYGNKKLWSYIQAANPQISDPALLTAGQRLVLP